MQNNGKIFLKDLVCFPLELCGTGAIEHCHAIFKLYRVPYLSYSDSEVKIYLFSVQNEHTITLLDHDGNLDLPNIGNHTVVMYRQ